jgi:hypothetical protein
MTSRAERQRNRPVKEPFNRENIRDWFTDSGGILKAKVQGVKK